MAARERIVVGYDHSPAGIAALRWAMRIAKDHDATVVVVHAFDRSDRADLDIKRDLDRARRDARYRTQARVLEVVGNSENRAPVRVSTPDGPVADVLRSAAPGALMVVIGRPQSERHRDLPSTLKDSCPCPIVAVDEQSVPVPAPAGFLA